jgi:oligoendopeptidase F
MAGEVTRAPYQIFSMFNNADIKFPEVIDEQGKRVEVTKGNISVFLRSADRDVRENAYSAMYKTYNSWENTLSASLSGAIKRNIFYANARKYDSSLKAALDSDNIPEKVYENVIDTLNIHLEPLHRYITLRKNVLKLDAVRPWDLYVPLLQEYRWEILYEEAMETIQEAVTPLGDDYVTVMREGFSSRWFDVYENAGKRSGAYSNAVYGISHPFILLNYQELLDDMFTIAHEMGHAVHSYYTMKNQPYIYSDYSIFVAEVASTLNEVLLMDYLLKNTGDPEKRIYLLNQYIDQIRGTMYIQAIFAEFEKVIHEKMETGVALTAEVFSGLTRDIYSKYYGPDFQMDDLFQINWCRIPHFYYNFYVFQYATGIAAAISLAQKIIAGDVRARESYINFLKSGGSDYPINLLNQAGVDMTSPRPIEETAQLFSHLIAEMEQLLPVGDPEKS